MKHSFVFLFLILCFSSFVFAQNPAKVSPDIYKVLVDNDDVTVMEVTFKPGQSDNMHSHLVHTVYVIQGGKIKLTMPDGTSKEMEVPSGATMHLDPEHIKQQILVILNLSCWQSNIKN